MVRPNSILVNTQGPVMASYGLLSPAVTVHEVDTQWFTTNMMYKVGDAGVKVVNYPIAGGSGTNKTVVDNSANQNLYRLYYPFSVEASISVSTMGTDPEDIKKTLNDAIDVVTQKAIEREFWHGDIAKTLTSPNANRYLASNTAVDLTPVSGTGVKTHYGVAILEKALGDATIGSAGVIHMNRDVASTLKLEKNEDQTALLTPLGSGVVAGAGYSAAGPTGVVAPQNQSWMYATGPVTVYLGPATVTPDEVRQAVNTQNNTITFYMDRPAAVTWSTSNLYAVLVDLTLDYA